MVEASTDPFESALARLALPEEANEDDATEALCRAMRRVAAPPNVPHRYRLLYEIGRGAMGAVWLAIDERLDRQVAIKFLDHGGRRGLERLAREARAIGTLDHPHVVKVFDVSIEPPDPHIVMEYVEGETLRQWQEGRAWEEIVAVYAQAGSGLAAAHDAGIVHRDFKPHNVVVGPVRKDRWRARVLDFGLARDRVSSEPSIVGPDQAPRGSADPGLTETGAVVGTLAYMAPEQCVGEAVGPAADQFAFCVALWEALFGRRPFEASSVAALHEAIVEQAPVAGDETRGARLRVQTVLRRGLSPVVAQRYPDIPALLVDLRRSVGRRSRAWWLLAGCVPILVALVWPATDEARACRDGASMNAWNPEVAQRIATAFAASDRSFAPISGRHVERTLSRYADDWGAAYVQVCEELGGARGRAASNADLRMACLERWEAQFEVIVQRMAAGDGTTIERASEVLASLPAPQRCTEVDVERLEAASPNETRVRALLALGRVERTAYRLDEAEQTLARARALAGDDSTSRITVELAVEAGLLDAARGRAAASEAELEDALRVATAEHHEDLVVDAAVALLHLVTEQRRFEDGERYGEIARRFAGEEPLRRAEVLDGMGVLRLRQGKSAEAEADLRAAAALRAGVLPTDEAWRITDTRSNLAIALAQQGKHEEALAQMRDVLRIEEATKGPEHVDTLTTRHNIGLALSRTGSWTEAEAEIAKAVSTAEGSGHAPPDLLCDWKENRALMLDFLERYEEAQSLALEVYACRSELFGSNHARTAKAAVAVAQILVDQGNRDEALPWAERAWLSLSTAEVQPDLRAYVAYLVATLLHDTRAVGTVPRQRALLEQARSFYREAGPDYEERLWNAEVYLERIETQASSKPSSDPPSDSSK